MELSDLIITIDTREQNQKRIKAVESLEEHGAIIEHLKLDLCDYHIEGTFREKDINIGIEAKSLQDFAGSHYELSDKLMRSYELYNHVGLFVETGSYSLALNEGLQAYIKNPAVRNGQADVLPLSVLENTLGSFANNGIIVRQLCYESQWPYTIYNTLIHVTKEIHTGLKVNYRNEYDVLMNMLVSIPGIGVKNAKKLISHFGNFYWMCVMSEQDIQSVLGQKVGHQFYDFVHSINLINEHMVMISPGARKEAVKFREDMEKKVNAKRC